MQNNDLISSLQEQNTTWKQAGFGELMDRPLEDPNISSSGFFSQDDIDTIFEQVSGSKILSGISKSPDGIMEANWDKGYFKIKFPAGEGFMLIGNVGQDPSGNEIQGILLHDGSNPIGFWGRQPAGF